MPLSEVVLPILPNAYESLCYQALFRFVKAGKMGRACHSKYMSSSKRLLLPTVRREQKYRWGRFLFFTYHGTKLESVLG